MPGKEHIMLVKALFPVGSMIIAALLVGCAAPVPPKPPLDTTPKARQPSPSTRASFACSGALPAVHRQICADDALAKLDKDLVARQHQLQQALDLAGSLLLAANHRLWLLSRGEVCGIDADAEPDTQAQACLAAMYRQ